MFRKQPLKNLSKPILNVEQLQQLVMELNEQNQEAGKMLNNSPWLCDRALQDISDTEADLIAGGQVTTVPILLDVKPIDVITEPRRTRAMLSKTSNSTGLAALSTKVRALLFANPFS